MQDCLTEDLFKCYCACKIGVLGLDAKESIVQRNFRRLEYLENNMEKLFKAMEKKYASNKGEEKQDRTTTSDGAKGPAVANAFPAEVE